jgi:hypothetical protein
MHNLSQGLRMFGGLVEEVKDFFDSGGCLCNNLLIASKKWLTNVSTDIVSAMIIAKIE